jgi:hypothetical protein
MTIPFVLLEQILIYGGGSLCHVQPDDIISFDKREYCPVLVTGIIRGCMLY